MKKGKRLLSVLVSICVMLTLLPSEAMTMVSAQFVGCTCETACSESEVNADCPVCSADYTKCVQRTAVRTSDALPAAETVNEAGMNDLSMFTKLEIREKTATGKVIVNLLNENNTSNWEISPQEDYYLCVTLRPGENKYVQLRYGGKNETCNGVSIANPIGGTDVKAGDALSHDAFDLCVQRNDFKNPTYGEEIDFSGKYKTALTIQDGTIVYHIKQPTENEASRETISFDIGFVVKGALYDGNGSIKDALGISVGSYGESTFQSAQETSINLKIMEKKGATSRVISTSATTELGGAGTPQQIYVLDNEDSDHGVVLLYDTIKFDVTYPAKAKINAYGFNTNFDQTNGTYGRVKLSDEIKETTQVNGVEMQTRTFTISHGFKDVNGRIAIYYRLSFPEGPDFNSAPLNGTKYTFTMTLPVVTMSKMAASDGTMGAGNVMAKSSEFFQSGSTTYDKTTYTLTELGTDATTLSAITSRPYIYNHTLDMDTDDYLVTLGSAVLKNGNGSATTPYEKTYEAEFNTTHTLAKITMITVPLGTYRSVNDGLQVAVRGKDTFGESQEVTLTDEQLKSAADQENNITESTYLQIFASAIGLDEITGVTANIGKLTAGYTSCSWSYGWSFAYNKSGAYGYFTDGSADRATGIQVKNTFRVYNTDPSLRDLNKGDLSVSTTVTSTDERRVGMNATTPELYKTDGTATPKKVGTIGTTSSVVAGETAVIKGKVFPYVVADAARLTEGGTTRSATMTMVQSPVLYLSLPLGLTPDTTLFNFYTVSYGKYDINAKYPINGSSLEYGWTAIGRRTIVNDAGETEERELYRITLPKDTRIGYYAKDGSYTQLAYEVAFRTDKSLETQRYRINDLITFTIDGGVEALPYNNVDNGTLVTTKEDIYSVNGGQRTIGVVKDQKDSKLGFGVQQEPEITVDSSISVTTINDQSVTPEWNTYSASNPNSIALLGQKSAGQVRLVVNNTSANASKDLSIVLPIPKAGTNLGALFMEMGTEKGETNGETTEGETPETQGLTEEEALALAAAEQEVPLPFGFDMNVTIADNSAEIQHFNFQYIDLTDGSYDDTNAFFGPDGKSTPYKIVGNAQEADAVLITAETLEKGEYELYFNYTIDGGKANDTNIWRPAYVYTVSNECRQRVGGYVASEIAPHAISGRVFADADRNGVQNSGEAGIAGVTVTAQDNFGRTETVTTDENGDYQFIAVRETSVTVTFTVDKSETYRFNVPAVSSTGSTGDAVASVVSPQADGLSASATVYSFSADGVPTKVNAAMGSFVTLSYSGNGSASGSVPAVRELVAGNSTTVAVKPDALQKNGYSFVSWNTSSDGEGTAYAPGATITVTENTTLYAIWEKATYTLTFNYRGATGGNKETTRSIQNDDLYGGIRSGSTYSNPLPEPTKVGYELNKTNSTGNSGYSGWATSATITYSNVSNNSKFTLGADTTLYAVWKAKSGYTVKYDLGYEGAEAISDKTGVTWTTYSLYPDTNPTRTGYNFDGWKCGLTEVKRLTQYGELAESDAENSFITLTAQWTPKGGYIVSYNANCGGSETVTNMPDAKTQVKWTETGLLPASSPVRAGYAFTGWALTSGESTEYVTAGMSYADLVNNTDTITTVTLYARWTEITGSTCVVKYDAQGGTPVADKVVENNSATGLLPQGTVTKTGFELVGWYTAAEEGNKVESTTTYKSIAGEATSVTLYAHWTEKSYTVAYNLNYAGASNPPTLKNVTWDGTGILPETAPTRTGYNLLGWYTEATGGTKVDASMPYSAIAENDITETVILYALWSERTFTVIYDSAGGDYVSPKSGVAYSSTAYLPDSTPAKLGYTLNGWKCGEEAADGEKKLGELVGENNTGTVTLTAQWIEKDGYTVNYNSNGGSAVNSLTGVTWTQTGLTSAENPTKPGYRFIGWTSNRVASVTQETAYSSLAATDATGSSVTLTAQWEEVAEYTVKYVSNCGITISDKTNVRWAQTALLPSVTLSKTGYALKGWRLSGNENSNLVLPSDSYASLAGDAETNTITLEAVWEVRIDYTVRFDVNGGQTVSDATGLKYEDSIPLSVLVRHGYSFDEWWYGEIMVKRNTTYAELAKSDQLTELTLTAKWTENKYTVNYDTNGGDKLEPATVTWEESVMPETPPTKLGYEFTRWTTDNNGSAVTVGENATISSLIPNDNATEITLTAVWTERTYTIQYTGEGFETFSRQNAAYTGSVMPESAPSRDYYVLLGWMYNDGKIADNATCADLLGTEANNEETITLTAIWGGNYTINYETGGGTVIASKKHVQWDDNGLIPEVVPSKEGFVFDYWSYNGTKVEATTLFSVLAGDGNETITGLTLTAVYKNAPDQSGTINGTVSDSETPPSPLQDIYVILTVGGTEGTIIAGPQITNANGEFQFSGVPYGIYTLVAAKMEDRDTPEQVITKVLTVDASTEEAVITMPGGQRNTYVTIKNETGEVTTAAADGLDKLLDQTVVEDNKGVTTADLTAVKDGATLNLTLEIEAKTVDAVKEDVEKIKTAAAVENPVVLPYDLSMYKKIIPKGQIATNVDRTKLISVPQTVTVYLTLPEEVQGKTIEVLRVHEGSAQKLSENTGEEYYTYESTSRLLTLHVQKFSTYAVVYSNASSGGGTGGTSGNLPPTWPDGNEDNWPGGGSGTGSGGGTVTGTLVLTFYANGGTEIPSVFCTRGTTVDLTLEKYIPTYDGYRFTGWYSDKALKHKVTSVRMTRNTSVYAGWEKAEPGLETDSETSAQTGATNGESAGENTPDNDAPGADPSTGTAVSPGSDGDGEHYQLCFETNGGSALLSSISAKYTIFDLTLDRFIPTRDGYIFTGWYADEALTQRVSSVCLTGNMVLYAGWVKAGSVSEEFIASPPNTGGISRINPLTILFTALFIALRFPRGKKHRRR